MKRSLGLVLLCGSILSGCAESVSGDREIIAGENGPSGQVIETCHPGETGCLGNILLSCSSDGVMVKTPCDGMVCAKENTTYTCMSQETYESLNKPQVGHDCESEWSKCENDVRYVCNGDFHWVQSENCAVSDKVCKQVGNVTACEAETGQMPEPRTDCADAEKQACEEDGKVCVVLGAETRCVSKKPEAQCTEGATDCDHDSLKTCTSDVWQVTSCPNGQKCSVSGIPAVAGCIVVSDMPHEALSGNAVVNISIKNDSSKAITISPSFRFVLSTEGTGAAYPCHRTERASFAGGEALTIGSRETRSFSNVEIPGDSKQYVGRHFARSSELGAYANNVLLYDTNHVSETFVPQMIDPATLFTDGGSYEIIYATNEVPMQPSTGNVFVNISIKNQSSHAITISPRFRFVLSTEGTGAEWPYNRTEAAVFAEAASLTIGSGETLSYHHVEIPDNSKQYVGQHFARADELHGYASNALLYDTEFNSDTIVPEMIDPSTLFKDGGTYNIVYAK